MTIRRRADDLCIRLIAGEFIHTLDSAPDRGIVLFL